MYKLPKEYERKAETGMTAALRKLELEWTREPQNAAIRAAIKCADYEKHFRGIVTLTECLRFYFSLIGDYESLLMLQEKAPIAVPPMNPRSLSSFIQYKRGPKGQTMTGLNGGSVVDICGNPILSTGAWKAPINLKQFNSAVTALHVAFDHDGPYQAQCEACLSSRDCRGCRSHLYTPRLVSRGNPVYDQCIRAEKRQNKKDGKKHRVKGAQPLTPFQLLALRNYLLSSNSLINLQLYVMCLVGVRLFLRWDEICGEKHGVFVGLSAESIDPTLSAINNGIVESLALQVNGKTDREWATLSLDQDKTQPLLCPIRHLEAYIYLIHWKGGPLFPGENELQNPPLDGIYTTSIFWR